MRDGAATLAAAVHSALAQCASRDEIVVVDDGSCDDPRAALPVDDRVRLLRQPEAGIAAALETGRAACRGQLIARLDADDLALPGRIAAQRRALADDPGLAAVGGRARLSRAGGPAPPGMSRYVAWVNQLSDRGAVHRNLLVESPLFHPAVTVRADALAAVGGWRQGDLPEDYDLWLRLATAGFGLSNVAREVVHIEDRPERLTRTDPRYRRQAFTRLKQQFLARPPCRVAVWGAGRSGRPWLTWAVSQEHDLVAVVDAFSSGERQGRAIERPAALAERELDLLVVAVGARGARAEIRRLLAELRPDLAEGESWVAVT